jgi:hypothetical protein
MPAPTQGVSPVPVRISREGLVIDRVVKVRISRHEDILWIAQDGGGPWTITFGKQSNEESTYPPAPGSPFTKAEYTVDKGGSGGSAGGPFPGTASKTYRYTVSEYHTGRITDDPDVDVE